MCKTFHTVYRLSAPSVGTYIIKDSTKLESHKSSWDSWELLARPRLQTPRRGLGFGMAPAQSQRPHCLSQGKTLVIRGQGSSFSQAEVLGDFLPDRMLQLFALATAKKFLPTHPSPCERPYLDQMREQGRGTGICQSGWVQGKDSGGDLFHTQLG